MKQYNTNANAGPIGKDGAWFELLLVCHQYSLVGVWRLVPAARLRNQ